MIGTTISHYKIIEKLGAGGMGEVFLAEDTKLGRKVALKFLPASTASDPAARERLLREARAASKLHHPNIVTIHSIEEHEGSDFIVMEFVEGIPIGQYVADHKLSSSDLNTVLVQLCAGLHHAHDSGVVHRDLKPDNILIDPDGRVRILDFGVALMRDTPRLTQTGSMVGTAAYVSPEQIQGKDADTRSDLFSLGVMMYELVAGKHPFSGPHESATLYSIAHEDPTPLTEVAPDVSSALAEVIKTCLSKNPAQRYASAREVSDRLTETSRSADLEVPVTRYAKSGTTNIAYQVFGSGSTDLVLVMGWVSHVELIWQHHFSRDFLERLGKRFRVMLFDKRGTGLSDRVGELPPLEQRMDDVRAVMDAADSKRAILMGISEGGPMCALFAATYPDRTAGLIIYGSYPVRIRDEEFPWAPSWEERELQIADVEQNWGGSMDAADLAPSESSNREFMKWLATYFRQSASPGAAAALLRMNSHVDIRSILPTIRAQSLILHRAGDRDVAVQCGRYMAERIPGARFEELAGEDHLPWVGDVDSIHEAIDRFVETIQSPKIIDTALLTALRLKVGTAGMDRWKSRVQQICEIHPPRQIHFEADGAMVLFEGPIRSLKVAEDLGAQLSQDGVSWSIGMHSGECTLKGDAATGMAVQVAKHLAEDGRDGVVRLTSTVRELVAGSGFDFVDAGDVVVPGINYTWNVVELPVAHIQAAPKSYPSIAVLPFANMSSDPENEFFADGLTEELLNVLARNPELKVTARTSSFAFKGKQVDLREIGQKLGVEHVLEGSVRKAGNRVRITAQLVKVADGFHCWSDTFDHVLDDIFAVQDAIADSVSKAMNVTLLGKSVPRSKGNPETLGLVVQANHFTTRFTKESVAKAVDLCGQALAIDPDDARAWSGLASAYLVQEAYGLGDNPGMDYGRVRDAAQKALALDDSLPGIWGTIAWLQLVVDLDWDKAEESFRKALALAPGDVGALIGVAIFESLVKNFGESQRLLRKAVELDPLNSESLLQLARTHFFAEQYAEARKYYGDALSLSPGITTAHASYGLALVLEGRLEEGIKEIKKEITPGYRSFGLAIALHALDRPTESDQAMAELMALGEQWNHQIASVYSYRGEFDEAFAALERAYELRDAGLTATANTPFFKPLHSDPRWPVFLEKIGLTP